ncbi:MAG: PTS sugar transporter subunit IIA [Streptococcus sp.]|nr:PTS sugar transporter subunit IIA [Streptococcus sp.]
MKFLFVSHGSLAKSMVESAQMIIGEQSNFQTLGLYPEDDIENLKNKVRKILIEFEGEDVICFTDLFSGSPFNAVVSVMGDYPVQHITGMNLPIVLEAFMMRMNPDLTIKEIKDQLMAMVPKTIVDVREFLKAAEN